MHLFSLFYCYKKREELCFHMQCKIGMVWLLYLFNNVLLRRHFQILHKRLRGKYVCLPAKIYHSLVGILINKDKYYLLSISTAIHRYCRRLWQQHQIQHWVGFYPLKMFRKAHECICVLFKILLLQQRFWDSPKIFSACLSAPLSPHPNTPLFLPYFFSHFTLHF